MDIYQITTFTIVLILAIGATIYYLITLKKVAEEERRVYHDFARRFIAGIAGGITVVIGTGISTVWNNGDSLEGRILGIVILVALMFFFIVLSVLLFVKMDRQSRTFKYLIDEGKKEIHTYKCKYYQEDKTKLKSVRDPHAIEIFEKLGFTKCKCVTEKKPKKSKK